MERLHRYSHSPSSESLQVCLRGVPASPSITPGTPAHVAAGIMLAPDAAAKQLAYLPVMLDGTFVGWVGPGPALGKGGISRRRKSTKHQPSSCRQTVAHAHMRDPVGCPCLPATPRACPPPHTAFLYLSIPCVSNPRRLLSRSALSDLLLGHYKGLYANVAAPRPSDAGSVSFGGVLPGRESTALESAPTLSSGLDDLLPLPTLSLKLPDHHQHQHHNNKHDNHDSSAQPAAAAAVAAYSAAPDPHAQVNLLHQPQGISTSPIDLGLGLGLYSLLGVGNAAAIAGDLPASHLRAVPSSVPLPPLDGGQLLSGHGASHAAQPHAHAQAVRAHHHASAPAAAAAAASTPLTLPPSHAQLEALLPLHMQLQNKLLEQQAVVAAAAAGLALPAVGGAAAAAATSHPLSGPPPPSLDLDAGLPGDVLPTSQSPREWAAGGEVQQQHHPEQSQQSQQQGGQGQGPGGSHGGGGSGQPGSPAVQQHQAHQAHSSTATTSVAQASMDAEHGVQDFAIG